MNDFQTAQLRRQLMRGYRQAGGVEATVSRRVCDLNGMPTGEVREVCRLYGLRYVKHGSMATVLMHIAGITAGNASAPQFCGVLMAGEAPGAGDKLMLGDVETDIIDADVSQGVAVTLVLAR